MKKLILLALVFSPTAFAGGPGGSGGQGGAGIHPPPKVILIHPGNGQGGNGMREFSLFEGGATGGVDFTIFKRLAQ